METARVGNEGGRDARGQQQTAPSTTERGLRRTFGCKMIRTFLAIPAVAGLPYCCGNGDGAGVAVGRRKAKLCAPSLPPQRAPPSPRWCASCSLAAARNQARRSTSEDDAVSIMTCDASGASQCSSQRKTAAALTLLTLDCARKVGPAWQERRTVDSKAKSAAPSRS
jgi:hypothetical protein